MCNYNLQNYGLTLPSSVHKTLVTAADADNVTVFITRNEGFPHLIHNFMTSGATLNIKKSTGLFAGKWRTLRLLLRIPMEYTRGKVTWNLPRQHDSLATTKLIRTSNENQNNT
jgi:hypothetical protein